MDQGPPEFTESLPILTVKGGSSLTYQLPGIKDPNAGAKSQMSIQLKAAVLFTMVDRGTLTFNPGMEFAGEQPYVIKITLSDDVSLTQSNYNLKLYVESPGKTSAVSQTGDSNSSSISVSPGSGTQPNSPSQPEYHNYNAKVTIVKATQNAQLIV